MLAVHINRKHTKAVSYSCSQCSFVCFAPGDLKNHMTTHQNGRLLRCDSCDFTTTSRSKMQTHKWSHRQRKVSVCFKGIIASTRPKLAHYYVMILLPLLCRSVCSRTVYNHSNEKRSLWIKCIKNKWLKIGWRGKLFLADQNQCVSKPTRVE